MKPHLALLWAVVCVALSACGGSGTPSPTATVGIVPTQPPARVDAEPAVTPVPTPSAADLTGFTYPLAGACLPKGDQLMPNAPRPYREGTHEGIDFYEVDNCTRIGLGTPVLAAKDGVVIRADFAYVELTPARELQLEHDPTAPEAIDAYRGRQVWLDHGNGVVTRYAHLSAIAPSTTVGSRVTKGQIIAYVGESGTPDSLTSPGSELHLHFELRAGDSYLGAGLAPSEVRRLYLRLFAN